MEKRRSKARSTSQPTNQRRVKPTFLGAVSAARGRAHEEMNYRGERRSGKSMSATIIGSAPIDEEDDIGLSKRILRWSLAIALLPFCWVTAWTFLSRFSMMNVKLGFWQSAEFWYFATGVFLMVGWFVSGLLKSMFLYLYVLGHELTHVVFVWLCRGKVTGFHVSTAGGYITTNKTNFVIALSPYFVPWWSVVAAAFFVLVHLFFEVSKTWDLALYGIMGLTWTFHVVWTIWMIPRDQPDLRENGTFLSLVIIFLGNLLVLVGLLCVASHAPLESFKDFGREWLRHAATWTDVGVRTLNGLYQELRVYSKV